MNLVDTLNCNFCDKKPTWHLYEEKRWHGIEDCYITNFDYESITFYSFVETFKNDFYCNDCKISKLVLNELTSDVW